MAWTRRGDLAPTTTTRHPSTPVAGCWSGCCSPLCNYNLPVRSYNHVSNSVKIEFGVQVPIEGDCENGILLFIYDEDAIVWQIQCEGTQGTPIHHALGHRSRCKCLHAQIQLEESTRAMARACW